MFTMRFDMRERGRLADAKLDAVEKVTAALAADSRFWRVAYR